MSVSVQGLPNPEDLCKAFKKKHTRLSKCLTKDGELKVLTAESRRAQGNMDLFFPSLSVTSLATQPYKNNHLFYGNTFITLAKQRGLR